MSRDWSRSIIAVCERINGAVRGSGDPLARTQIDFDTLWLREQLLAWETYDKSRQMADYDLAVRRLAQAAIELGRSAL